MGLLRKFQQIFPRSSLFTIYKTFIRSQVDYVDIIYDQGYNSAFHDKLESIQYNACLTIAGAIRATSTEKIYQELGLECFKSRQIVGLEKFVIFMRYSVKNSSGIYLI